MSFIKKELSMKHIYDFDAINRIKKLNKMKLTESRYVPHKYFSVVSTNVCGDIVLIMIFKNPFIVIRIKNKEVAESYRKFFNFIWEKAR